MFASPEVEPRKVLLLALLTLPAVAPRNVLSLTPVAGLPPQDFQPTAVLFTPVVTASAA